ncbi:hypothetical protein DVW02_03555 [Clostridium botulinum]|nr:hypothetical protein [Clostridium botulinum]
MLKMLIQAKLMLNDCYNALVSILNSAEEENKIGAYINKILERFNKILKKLNDDKSIELEI